MKKCPDCGSYNMDGNYCNECEGDNQGEPRPKSIYYSEEAKDNKSLTKRRMDSRKKILFKNFKDGVFDK